MASKRRSRFNFLCLCIVLLFSFGCAGLQGNGRVILSWLIIRALKSLRKWVLMQMESMHSRYDEDFITPKETLSLPKELRDELKNPLGEVVLEDHLEEALRNSEKIVTVGDLCSITLYDHGIVPDIAVVDYTTRRGDIGELKAKILKIGQSVINVNNPGGMITKELWEAIETAYQSRLKVRIEVTGEEDLATLPAVWLAPEKTAVIYGLPGIGLIVVTDLNDAKTKVKNVLTKMK